MKKRALSLVAGAFAFLSIGGAGLAQDGSQLTAAEAAKTRAMLQVATGVITLGRSNKDPMMLIVGAKILSGLGAVSSEGDASSALDIATVLDEAKGLAGDNQYLLDEIAAVPAETERGARYCNWYQDCGYSIVDPYACREVMVCN